MDGLRAVAVLAVVLYHFGVPGLGGGFVGVDVFFVISGFLIGGLLWKELDETGRISLGRFYLRRIRRLAPAFIAMAVVTSVAAWVILLPFEFREFGKHLIAATVWLSNVQFWREAGYFDVAADSKVLLHTWSLSVEEQFYIVLPLTLLALRFSRRVTTGLLVVAWLTSAVACVALTPSQPVATFFLFPFRAWELLTGVLLALWLRADRRRIPGLAGPLGLALIIGAIFLVGPDGFPGWQAIIPVAGTALLLAGAGRAGPVNRMLALPPAVFVGLISYSLYLWHWPVLVLSRYWRDGYSGPMETAQWLGLSVILAILSWAIVERPLRQSFSIPPLQFVGGAALCAIALVAFGGVAFIRDGLPGRFDEQAQAHIAASQDFLQDWSRCTTDDEGHFAGIEICRIGPDGPPEVVIWGDSHLRALMNGLGLAALEADTPGWIIWRAGCPPLFGIIKEETAATPAQNAACTDANDQLEQAFGTLDSAKRILLVARWSYYAEGAGVGRDAQNLITMEPTPASGYAATEQPDLFGEAITRTVATLGAIFDEVHIARQVAEIPWYDSREVARGLAHGRLDAMDVSALSTVEEEKLAARVANSEFPIYAIHLSGNAQLIDTWQTLCPERCSILISGTPVYFDNNHLTNAGALAIRSLFLPFLTGEDT
ncbi:acyltransferase family protein [Alexandriicola marinus]|uniref:acyltransferase family protein n=1 Tax=Alexandriicola marinus TaxID=2081710 RepID=UPI0030B83E29